jgi:hypothetical protein
MPRQDHLFVSLLKGVQLGRSDLDQSKLGRNKEPVQENQQQDDDQIEEDRSGGAKLGLNLGRSCYGKPKGNSCGHRFNCSGQRTTGLSHFKSVIRLRIVKAARISGGIDARRCADETLPRNFPVPTNSIS